MGRFLGVSGSICEVENVLDVLWLLVPKGSEKSIRVAGRWTLLGSLLRHSWLASMASIHGWHYGLVYWLKAYI